MEYVQPEPLKLPIECDCFGEPFTINGKKVLVVDGESRTSRHAGALALGMIMGMAESFGGLRSFEGCRDIKPRKAHKPHSGAKERERRLKKLAVRKDT